MLESLNIDLIQCIVLILGVAEVLLARANNVWLYPTGIAAIVLSVYSLFGAQLYAECLLNLYYLSMSVYGWHYWLTKKDNRTVPVTMTSRPEWLITGAIIVLGWVFLWIILANFTDSNVAAWDAWVSSTGWAGMWLLARRKVENWIVLNISNAFAIPLMFYKDLPLYAILTTFLFIVACKGYFDWMKIVKQNSSLNEALS